MFLPIIISWNINDEAGLGLERTMVASFLARKWKLHELKWYTLGFDDVELVSTKIGMH
jgi:hypothetical protein